MKKQFLLLTSIAIATIGYSQDDKIQADRPSKSLTSELTKKGFFQFETGIEKEQQNKTDYSLTHPELQIKYGLSDRLELRAELVAESNRQYSSQKFDYGLKPVELGFKAKLIEQKGWLPNTSFYSQVGIPSFASADHKTTHAVPELRLLMQNQFAKIFHLNYNVGAAWDGEENSPRWLYSIDQEIEVSKQWEVFVETFAYFQKGHAAQHHVDGGIAYFPTKDIKLDVFAGKGLSKEAHEYFISAGLSFRLK